MKTLDWNKITSPLPIKKINKGHVQTMPLSQAYGNAKEVVAPRLDYQPIPLPVIHKGE